MFTINWIGASGQPTGHTTEAEDAATFAEAVWGATKLLRTMAKEQTDAMNAGDVPVGFYISEGDA